MDRPMMSRVRRFDCNPGQCVRIQTRSEQHCDVHCAAVSFVHKNDSLMHYGVSGQKWGVITKEYEPVAVDHRKTRGFVANRVAKYRQQVARDEAEVRQINEIRRQKTEQHRRTRQKIAWAAAAAISLFVIYKGYRYAKIKNARAYSGVLVNYLKKTPGANLTTPEGKALYKRGMELAKANARIVDNSEGVARYLERTGQAIPKKEALRYYKLRRATGKYLNAKTGGTGAIGALQNQRSQKLYSKLLKKAKPIAIKRG